LTLLSTPLLWALGFSNLPLLQMGIAAASLPILIHLLNRRKYRETSWAAMRFLLAAIRKNQKRIKVEQWLLLAIRTLLILFVVSAMAKPFLESLGAMQLLPGERTHRVIVLDGSLSMAYAAGDRQRFDEAKDLAARLVRDSRGGDVLSVVLMADPPRVVIGDASPSANQAEVLKEIAQIPLTHGGTDLVASLGAVDRALEVSTIPRKEVVFITDLQAASWRKSGVEEALKRAVAKLEARKAQSIVIDLGKAGGENRAVTDLRLNQPVVTLGSTDLVATATVKNFGPSPLNGARVRLLVDGQLGPELPPVDLPVGVDVPVVFRPSFPTAGDHVLEVKIDDDPLPLDNRRWMAVPVKDALRVLLVDGHYKAEAFESETDYLAQALNPASTSTGSPSSIRVEVITESGLARRDLAPYDAVVLCNVGQFSEAEVTGLDAYLKQGGGVIVFGGDQVVPDNYNRLLFADGKGLLPASLGATVGDSDRKQSAFDFNPLGFSHPIVAPFAGADAPVIAGLVNAKTWRYHKLTIPPGSQAKVALAFSSGDPAIVEAPRHRGRVIQVATSADSGWTTWPLHTSFAPVMEQVVLQAAGGRLAERNVRVGQPLDQVLPASASNTSADVSRPDDAKAQVKLKPSGDVSLFHFDETDLSGAYRVRYNSQGLGEATFAANPDPLESDPLKLDKAGLSDAVPGWKFTLLTNWQDLTGSSVSVGRHGELHRQLLYGVLLLLIVESIMAWRFGHHAG
jgi:hypothetical protein